MSEHPVSETDEIDDVEGEFALQPAACRAHPPAVLIAGVVTDDEHGDTTSTIRPHPACRHKACSSSTSVSLNTPSRNRPGFATSHQ
jgi:hypothetical protein